MTITVEAYTGTESVSTTEHSLTTDTAGPDADTTAGIYQAFVDLSNMASGDGYRLRCYEKCRTGDTQRLVFQQDFDGVQATPLAATPTLVLGIGWDFTLTRLAGTNRTINWRISAIT